MTTVAPRLYTAEELLDLDPPASGGRWELVRGHLIEEPPMAWDHNWVGSNIYDVLRAFVRRTGEGVVLYETSFRLMRNPDTLRRTDVCFFRGEPGERWFIDRAPDLAVEIVSPNDRDVDVQRKVEEYLAAGSARVWVVRPSTRTVMVHRPDGSARVYREADVPDSEAAGLETPGLQLPVIDIFRGVLP